MKKFLTIFIAVAVLLMAGMSGPEPSPAADLPPSIFDGIKDNATLDILYDFKTGEALAGAGVPLAEYKEGLIEARLEFASNLKGDSLVGGILSVDPLKAIEMTNAKDWEWIANFNFRTGIGFLANMSEPFDGIDNLHTVGYLKLIQMF